MNDTEKKRLQSILRKIDILHKEVKALLGGEIITERKKTEISQETKELINSIDLISSDDLKIKLEALKHKELGEVFVAVGGTSGDKRKPKAWLIERILWLAKEFAEGHRAIRES